MSGERDIDGIIIGGPHPMQPDIDHRNRNRRGCFTLLGIGIPLGIVLELAFGGVHMPSINLPSLPSSSSSEGQGLPVETLKNLKDWTSYTWELDRINYQDLFAVHGPLKLIYDKIPGFSGESVYSGPNGQQVAYPRNSFVKIQDASGASMWAVVDPNDPALNAFLGQGIGDKGHVEASVDNGMFGIVGLPEDPQTKQKFQAPNNYTNFTNVGYALILRHGNLKQVTSTNVQSSVKIATPTGTMDHSPFLRSGNTINNPRKVGREQKIKFGYNAATGRRV